MTYEEARTNIVGIELQMADDEARTLFTAASALPPTAVIVEIGTFMGGSAALLAQTGNTVYTVDKEILCYETLSKFPNIKMVEGDSVVVAGVWTTPIDFLFIDADHTYEGARADLRAWLPHVKPGGIVVFHDYDSHVGITKAVNEAIEDKRIGFQSTILITKKAI